MGYREAMEAAGAVVTDFAEFGSYQGEWLAVVTYEGRTGIVAGYYGSCSGCDSFEAEFGWSWADGRCDAHEYADAVPACAACDEAKATNDARLVRFGARYAEGIMTPDELARYVRDTVQRSEWDTDTADVLAWLTRHGVAV